MFSFDSSTVTFDSPDDEFTGLAAAFTLTCRSDQELAAMLASLRPRGDAWRFGGFDGLRGSVMGRFFAGLGAACGPTERRLCALVDEFFCTSAAETREIWEAEHGLPDACDPFVDLCDKVNAVGDGVPAYAASVARRHGWAITIGEEYTTLVEDCALGHGRTGALIMGAESGVVWRVGVDLALSPAYFASGRGGPLLGAALMRDGFSCGPDLDALVCLLRRIAPAHADLAIQTIN